MFLQCVPMFPRLRPTQHKLSHTICVLKTENTFRNLFPGHNFNHDVFSFALAFTTDLILLEIFSSCAFLLETSYKVYRIP